MFYIIIIIAIIVIFVIVTKKVQQTVLCLKCPYDQKVFLGFDISMTSKNVFKLRFFFAIKSSFKFPALATPSEIDHVIKDW